MPNLTWSHLNKQQLGRYGEIWTFMEFLSYGLNVYPTEVDDHGVDLVVKDVRGKYWDVQVKSVRGWTYIYFKTDYIDRANALDEPNLLVCYMNFVDGCMPEVFLFPSTVFMNVHDGGVFKDRGYEYGISVSKRNRHELEEYHLEDVVKSLML